MRQLLDRLFQTRTTPRKVPGSVVSFISNKGGVGKSTLSVNTACDLATRHPGQVLLIDASLQLGICGLMLDIIPPATLTDAVREKERLDETLLRRLTVSHPCGLHLLAAPKDAVEAAEVDDASFARVLNVARRVFDYVVIDTFPILDSLVLSLLDVSDLVLVVLQGTVPNVVGAVKFISVLDGLGVPPERQRVVLNQNYAGFAGNLTPADIEQRLGREIDYVFPYRKKMLVAMNTGRPFILNSLRFFGFGRQMTALVDDIESVRDAERPAGAGLPGSALSQKAPVMSTSFPADEMPQRSAAEIQRAAAALPFERRAGAPARRHPEACRARRVRGVVAARSNRLAEPFRLSRGQGRPAGPSAA